MADTTTFPPRKEAHTCVCMDSNVAHVALSEAEIDQEFRALRPVWRLAEDGKCIFRTFTCRNWQAAVDTIQAVSIIAESREIQHHPDLHLTNYRDLEIRISTHATGGLTSVDFVLAKAIDQVKIDYSPKWLKANPLAADEA